MDKVRWSVRLRAVIAGLAENLTSSQTCRIRRHGPILERRRLENSRRIVVADGAIAASASHAPARLPQSPSSRQSGDECHSLCAPHRLPVERSGRHRNLYLLFGLPAFPRVAGGGRLPGILETRAFGLWRVEGHRLEMVVHGRSDDQGSLGRGKKPAPIRPTGPSWEPSEASWLKRVVFQLASPSMEPTGTTSKWRGRRSKASPLADPNQRPKPHRISASTKATTMTRSETWRMNSTSLLTSVLAAKRASSWSEALEKRRADGWASALILGWIAFADCLFAGKFEPIHIWLCSILRWVPLRGFKYPYRNRL